MDVAALAEALVARAVDCGSAVLRCNGETPTEELRTAVRHLASQQSVRIRTGMIEDVLAVVLADADLWDEPVSVMRSKLVTPITFNTVH